MGVTLRHGRIRVPQYLLDLVERPPAVHQEACILMPEIVNA